jgi:hypothetical protein
MKNFTLFILFVFLVFSAALNIALWQEMDTLRAEINRIVMPVDDFELEKLMEEIKNLSNMDINAGNDT